MSKKNDYPIHLGTGEYQLSNGKAIKGYSKAKEAQNKLDREKANFTAVYKKGVQIGPDSWDVEFFTKQLSPDTTIRELQKWYAESNDNRPMQITINEERE